MVVVTGAAGHLGNVLVRELLNEGEQVRVLIMQNEDISALKGLDIEYRVGDVRDVSTLEDAFAGAEKVFHVAGLIAIIPGKAHLLDEINVKGTRNVVEACIRAKVKRLIYTSSVHALADIPLGATIDENIPISPDLAVGDYGKSKAKATIEVLKGVERGLDAVVVCPAGVIGPFDFRPSRMGRVILSCLKKSPNLCPKGAYNFVDVRDVARGEILAAKRGKTGEVYILSGEIINVADMEYTVKQLVGLPTRILEVPLSLCKAAASLVTWVSKLFRKEPVFTSESLYILQSNCNLSNEKAKKHLGFIVDTIRDTIFWFKKNYSFR